MPAPPAVKSRRPTGRVPWPVILVEGGEKAGKSWAFAEFSGSSRIGQSYYLDLGEGTAEEYGNVPGARFEILDHDGTYAQILTRVREVKALARWAVDNGQPPVALGVDTIGDIWEGLKDWAADRARARRKKGPDEEVTVSMDLWNDSGARYRKLMTELLTFPGVVVLLARGKEIALVEGGKPVEGKKDYRVEGHKSLAYDATVWVRMSRTGPPEIIGARSVHAGIRPGRDKPQQVIDKAADGRLLEWLVFDALRVDPQAAQVRDYQPTTGGELTADERAGSAAAPQPANRPGRGGQPAQSGPTDADLVNQLTADIKAATGVDQLRAAQARLAENEKTGDLTGAGAAHLKGWLNARRRALGLASDDTLLRLRTAMVDRGAKDADEHLIVAVRVTGRGDIDGLDALTEAEATAAVRAVEETAAGVELLTGEQIPEGAGVDPATFAQDDDGQEQAPASEQAA